MIKRSIQEKDITIVNIMQTTKEHLIHKTNANSHKRGN